MIKNYGLLWQRKYVHLGSGGKGKKGTLLGYRGNVGSVDFREQIGIYVLYDKDFLPAYVGQAGNGNANLFSRLKTHTKDHLWNRWEYFSWFGLLDVTATGKKLDARFSVEHKRHESGGTILNELEGILIAAMEPKLNKQGAKFADAQRYDQDIDDGIIDLSLEDISNQIVELQTEFGKLRKIVTKK
jgi:hypothetical protein